MNFADLRFWSVFLAALATVLMFRLLVWRKAHICAVYDRVALLSIGLTLLLSVSWKSCLIFLAVSQTTFFGVAAILRWAPAHRRLGLWVLVPLQLAPLFFYKYAHFVVNEIARLQIDALRELAIPIGISFYTFQKIAFACDTLAFGKSLPKFLDFMNFAAFFPQIVAGPIERRDALLPQMESFRFRWSADAIDAGVTWIALGMFFKRCLADNFALFFRAGAVDNAWTIWAANALFGLRIYYDFAGYSFIAVGLAKCLGIRLTLNFASPYCSRSVSEFWRRWHITLSQWFRDYLYLPLGGSRVRYWPANVIIVFLISGIWHGAGWNFVLWGALHGVFLLIHRFTLGKLACPAWLGWAATLLAVFLAWLSFYELDPHLLRQKLATLFSPTAYSFTNLRALPAQWDGGEQFTLAGFLLLATVTHLLECRSLPRGGEPYHQLRRLPVLAGLVILTVLLAPGQQNAFIYFAF